LDRIQVLLAVAAETWRKAFMTTTPPPGNYPPPPPLPPGNYSPPPPPPPFPSGGYYPTPQSGGFAPPPSESLSSGAYTSWPTRVLAFLIDYLPYAVLVGIGYGIEAATQETACVTDTSEYNLGEFCATGNSTLGVTALLLSVLVGLGYVIWNYGYKQGTTGSSIGKTIMKFRVISEKTGQPIGFGRSVLRQLAHVLDSLVCFLGYLFPLWDAKRQTFADKIMTTVCVAIT
jgi:uncharacterized RDD family membrane protein YckC